MNKETTERVTDTAPAMTELDAEHLQITQSWTTGESRTIHVIANGDLDQLLRKGTDACNPHEGFTSDESGGYVVVALDVDGCHDQVHYQARFGGDSTLLDRAIASLTASRDALRKLHAVS
jgi:hypothetical protein